jgi:hypothetical protein
MSLLPFPSLQVLHFPILHLLIFNQLHQSCRFTSSQYFPFFNLFSHFHLLFLIPHLYRSKTHQGTLHSDHPHLLHHIQWFPGFLFQVYDIHFFLVSITSLFFLFASYRTVLVFWFCFTFPQISYPTWSKNYANPFWY